MSVAREPLDGWEASPPRLSVAGMLAAMYWLGALGLAVRAYDIGFHRYVPRGVSPDDEVLLTLARDAGLWRAALTLSAAFLVFLVLIAARWLGDRLVRRR